MEQKIDPNEQRAIGYIEGRLEGLATKEFVRKTVQDSIDKQTDQMERRFDKLEDEIKKGRDWRNRIVGGGISLTLLVTIIANLTSS